MSPLVKQDASEAVRSEAWRGFCRHGTILTHVYECRGTRLLDELKSVTLQELNKCALAQCRGTIGVEGWICHLRRNYLRVGRVSGYIDQQKAVPKAVAVCKNRDKQMPFIVRVRIAEHFVLAGFIFNVGCQRNHL